MLKSGKLITNFVEIYDQGAEWFGTLRVDSLWAFIKKGYWRFVAFSLLEDIASQNRGTPT